MNQSSTQALSDRAVPPAERPHFFSAPPPHADRALERLYRKQRLAAGFRLFARFGYNVGLAGHITARDPERPDHFWAHRWGMPFKQVSVSNLVLVGPDGDVIGNDEVPAPLSGAAFPFHAGIYRARPDVGSVAHAHSFYATSWSAFGRLLDPVSQNSAAFFERHSIFDEYNGIPFDHNDGKFAFDMDEGARIARALGENDVVLLKNHGQVTVGQSVELCVWRFIAFEYACRIQMQCESLPRLAPCVMSPEVARATAKVVGSEAAQWLGFNALWQEALQEAPGCLD